MLWDTKKVKLIMTKGLASNWNKPLQDKFMQEKFFFQQVFEIQIN